VKKTRGRIFGRGKFTQDEIKRGRTTVSYTTAARIKGVDEQGKGNLVPTEKNCRESKRGSTLEQTSLRRTSKFYPRTLPLPAPGEESMGRGKKEKRS